jgi:hypothetical protein
MERLPNDIPDRDVDRSLGGRVGDRPVQTGVHRFAFEGRVADDLRGEDAVDDSDDRALRLAVGERPRWRLGRTDEAVVGVHAHQHVLGDGDLTAGEPERLAVRDSERDRLHPGDLHWVPLSLLWYLRGRISGG